MNDYMEGKMINWRWTDEWKEFFWVFLPLKPYNKHVRGRLRAPSSFICVHLDNVLICMQLCLCMHVGCGVHVMRGRVFSPRGPDKRLQSSASPWQQVLGYNLSVKPNGARVTRPWAGVLPVSPITSAGPVACVVSITRRHPQRLYNVEETPLLFHLAASEQ